MHEPVFVAGNAPAWQNIDASPGSTERSRDSALLWRATNLAIESAFRFGHDLPVGAVAAHQDLIVGRYFASDRRIGYQQAHAEYMAVMDWKVPAALLRTLAPDTVVVSLEPCDNCQDFLATIPNIKRVAFGLPRTAAEERGLIKPHAETIYQRALRVGLPYQVVQIEDEQLPSANEAILDHTRRNPEAETVEIDRLGLQRALSTL